MSFESDALSYALKRVNLTRRGLQSAIEGRVAECLEAGAGERRGGGSSSQDRRGGGGCHALEGVAPLQRVSTMWIFVLGKKVGIYMGN